MNEIPAPIPSEKRELLERLIAQLASVPGVKSLVLGGSYARGAQRPDLDLDIAARAGPQKRSALRCRRRPSYARAWAGWQALARFPHPGFDIPGHAAQLRVVASIGFP